MAGCDASILRLQWEKGSSRVKPFGMIKAMPTLWKEMTIERRHELVNTMDAFQLKGSPRLWTKENVLALMKFDPLNSVSKLRTCYLALLDVIHLSLLKTTGQHM